MGFITQFYAHSAARSSISGKSCCKGTGLRARPIGEATSAAGIRLCDAKMLNSLRNLSTQGERQMDAGNESAAAILVQTIFLKDGHLQGLLGEQATKSPIAAAEFLKPFYRAALAMVAKTKSEGTA